MTLNYNEITKKKYIILDGTPYEVLDSKVFRKQQRKPVNQTKLRNLITGKVKEETFQHSDEVEEADVKKKNYIYVYNHRGEYWFHDIDDPSERFSVSTDIIPEEFKYIKEEDEVTALVFDDKIIDFDLPIKVELRVKEAPPAVRGNTATGATKEVVLETGARVQTPLFINRGDTVEINTEKGEYTGRVEKK